MSCATDVVIVAQNNASVKIDFLIYLILELFSFINHLKK